MKKIPTVTIKVKPDWSDQQKKRFQKIVEFHRGFISTDLTMMGHDHNALIHFATRKEALKFVKYMKMEKVFENDMIPLSDGKQVITEDSKLGAFLKGTVYGAMGSGLGAIGSVIGSSGLAYGAAGGAFVLVVPTLGLPALMTVGAVSAIGAVIGGSVSTLFAAGKQRTMSEKLTKCVKELDVGLAELRVSKDPVLAKRLSRISKNAEQMTEQLLKDVEQGHGGAGQFRRNLSTRELIKLLDDLSHVRVVSGKLAKELKKINLKKVNESVDMDESDFSKFMSVKVENKSLEEASRMKAFWVGGSIASIASLMVTTIAMAGVPLMIPLMIPSAILTLLWTGLFTSLFASGTQRTMASELDDELADIKNGIQSLQSMDKGSLVDKIKLKMLKSKMDNALELSEALEFELRQRTGDAGLLRDNISKSEVEKARKNFKNTIKYLKQVKKIVNKIK